MKGHLLNAFFGVLDYVAYPAGMLLVTPVILMHRGPEEYGVLAIATALVSTGAILASGFGDAGIQAVAAARGQRNRHAVVRAVGAMMAIHVVLGGVLAGSVIAASSAAARYLIPGADAQIRERCVSCLHSAGVLLFLRAVEAVCVSTQRAFDRYGTVVAISVAARLLGLATAGVLAVRGHSVGDLLEAIACVQGLSVGVQLWHLARRTGGRALIPSFDWTDVSTIAEQGRYTWFIAASGVLFSYADRMVLGFSRGAGALVWYALSIQLAQPIYGITASGLHFLFPYLARIKQSVHPPEFAHFLRRAVAANAALVILLTGITAAAGPRLLLLLGRSSPGYTRGLLPVVLISFALMSASVVAVYALIAIRKAREVAVILSAGALGMAAGMPLLLHLWGVEGLAAARLLYGAVCLLLYRQLFFALRPATELRPAAALSRVCIPKLEGEA